MVIISKSCCPRGGVCVWGGILTVLNLNTVQYVKNEDVRAHAIFAPWLMIIGIIQIISLHEIPRHFISLHFLGPINAFFGQKKKKKKKLYLS